MRFRMLATMVGLVAGAGCEKNLLAELPDAAPDAAPDASPGTALSHTLYLNAEGVTILVGADDATTNHSSIVVHAATLTKYLAADAQRQTRIAGLVSQVTSTLAVYHVDVVTIRPAAGPYDMIVITDDNSSVTGEPDGITSNTVLESGCNQIPSVIGFVFGGTVPIPVDEAGSVAIDMFGNNNGIPESVKPGDCMCRVDAGCTFTAPCTIGGTGTPTATVGNCGLGPTVDEAAMFLATFGPH